MKRLSVLMTLMLPGALTGAHASGRAAPVTPVVVELFQSQGCSDCPPAQINLNRLADKPEILALSFAVTYWDQLGWKDSFASPQFTQRQRDYANRDGGGGIATPQYWINGRQTVIGANPRRVDSLIAQGAPANGPGVAIGAGRVTIESGQAPSGGADVWLIRYDPRVIAVSISAGENRGRTIPHRDVVRELILIGRWAGREETLSLPSAKMAGLRTAILVQAGRGGPILAATKA